MTDDERFLNLWGKTDRSPGGRPDNFHPVLFHLIDVAYCADELWKVLPGAIKRRMASAIAMDVELAGTLFVLLAGLHDIGKAYPKFQAQAEQFVNALYSAGFDFPADTLSHPHNFVSAPEVRRLFDEQRLFPEALASGLSQIFAYMLAAHHGVFPHPEDLTAIKGRVLGENADWEDARNWLADQLKDAIPPVAAPDPALSAVPDAAFAPLLAAFISLADWFGSSNHFKMNGALPIVQYRRSSRQSAQNALTRSGWKKPLPPVAPASFSEMFAYLDKERAILPNALQTTVLELLKGVTGPALWLIEEEMGAGKTEAALCIYDHAQVNGYAHGTYVAMPTQATSNAMFDRVGSFLHARYPNEDLNLILAHSHAMLDEQYRERMKIADTFSSPIYNEDEGRDDGRLVVQSWFTHNKQTLLAHYGVGTIDQALMGVLQTRHWFVRLFGLSGKVVIFDEVHAYDAYMSTLLSQLITWLAELDCTVVLLSATLPQSIRMKLADAYAKGSRRQLDSAGAAARYPRITVVQKGEPASAHDVTIQKLHEPDPKHVKLLHRPNTPEEVRKALLEAIPGDGCAIVICNTVASAQNMYRALRDDEELEGWTFLLFHARTPFVWRKKTEDRVLELFGKKSGAERTKPREKTILIATQVAEQSLDIDADFMASEVAPVDLILQRIGRLYRHVRSRTSAGPQFVLLGDIDERGLPIFGNIGAVYAPYTLLRSWIALKSRTEIVIPTDIEPLVAEVYDQDAPADLGEALQSALPPAFADLQLKQKDQRDHARKVSVRPQPADATFRDWVEDLKPPLLDDDDPEIHRTLLAATRDGDPSLIVILCGTDSKRDSLALNPEGEITPGQAQQMMGFSVSLSNKGVYYALKFEKPPSNWQKNSLLKHTRRIEMNNGVARIGDRIELTLSQELGLVIGTRKQ